MDEYPKCPICSDIYGTDNSHVRAPKVLKCGDSICKECLEKLIQENDEENFLCPICKKNIKKEENIDDYIPNKQMISLVNSFFNIPEEEITINELDRIIKYSIILLGNSYVGKTSIFRRLSKVKYDDVYSLTIGVDITKYYIKYKNKKYELIFHDTGGLEQYRSLTKNFLQNKNGVLFIYDITDKKSFNDLEYWYNLYKEQNEMVVGLIIGNKCDLELDRKVDEEDAKDFADIHGLKYIETSAKLDKNVKKAIALILEEIIKSKPSYQFTEIENLSNQPTFRRNNQNKKCPC